MSEPRTGQRAGQGRRAALRKLQRRYPDGTAPSAVVDRYEFLRARYNAQVRLVNKAVRAHNRLLRQVCRPFFPATQRIAS